ncbi:hypothetical protein GGF42_002879 [Coemansia sp. RSA 2424]|nr:hypothetical protein GGF42_002879 [Coemansia sp. RSA 2424]
MVKINETAEARIATAIERYGGEIEDPAIREVWERQLREDVMEKVNRIKERQTCCADMLRQAKERELNPGSDDGRRRHSPILALYLYAGERCLDWLISWMRGNSHFCYEPGEANSLPGSVSLESLMGGYENGSGSASIAPTKSVAGEDIAIHVATRASPLPYIAVAQSRPLLPPLSETMPEPSAPTLSESQFLKMVPPPRLPDTPPLDDYKTTGPSAESLSMATTSAHQGSRDAGRQAADSSEQQLRYEVLEPPPYTPVAGLDSESEQEPAIQNKEVRAIVADNESH